MKKWFFCLLVLAGVVIEPRAVLAAANPNEEQPLIQVLQSNAGPGEKDAACARLKLVGTARCIPALAALLSDEQLSHSARYALEPMPYPAAGRALLEALSKTKNSLRAGIINSLAARGEKEAEQPLIRLLGEPDLETAAASARALGQLGGTDAVAALRACTRGSKGALHDAAVDGLLRAGNGLLMTGKRSFAMAIFEQLDVAEEKDSVQTAAFRGRVGASGNAGLNMVLHAIAGQPGPHQVAALQLARGLQAPHTTRELARLLPAVTPSVQAALIQCLAQRGDVSVIPELKSFASKASQETWLAIIQAMDELGDASVVPILANWAASSLPEVSRAARQALTDLRRGDVTRALIAELGNPNPAAQAEAAHALGGRGDKSAVPRLVELARSGPVAARKGVLQALSVLIDEARIGALVDLVIEAKDPSLRAETAEALNSAYQRIQTTQGHANATALVQGIQKGSTDSRSALLPLCGGLVDPQVRTVLRIALHDQDPLVRNAAVRALCDTVDGELLPDLLALARLTSDEAIRTLAIGGAVRLTTQEDTAKLTTAQKMPALKALLACATTPEQKRKVLAGLGEVPDVEALGAIEGTLSEPAIRNEAARAAIKVAAALPGTQAIACEQTLKKVLAVADEEGTRQAVHAALKQIQDNSDYLTNWQVAGPYRQTDKDYAALFDIAFPPESGASSSVAWKTLAAGSDPKRPWVMDLLKALGGQQCAAYARTWIHSDRQCGATVELGSDDGVKVWLNDKQVYALNTARPLQPASDKIEVNLHSGWNSLLLKVTQNNQGWEFCVRVRNHDGSHLEGLRCDAAPRAEAR